MSKVSINRENKERVLLTELLPYEVPILFSNDGFYNIVNTDKHSSFIDKIKALMPVPYGIPFNYEIPKSIEGETRSLSIIHPYHQIEFIDLYEKYSSLMLHL